MLDADYLLHLTEGAEAIAETLHNDIIRRVVARVMARIGRGDAILLTAADRYQLEILEDAGYLAEEIQKEIARRTKLQVKEIKAAYEDAGIKAVQYDDAVYAAAGLEPKALSQSPQLIRLLQSGYESTLKTWDNLCHTIANRAQQVFIQECDTAYRLVSSGAISHTEAVADAINRIAAQGITIKYPSGHTDTIETATLRCVRTGVAQACSDITTARMDEMEWDIVLTSAHLGARYTDADDYTNHEWWQGKFYSRSGDDPRFPPFDVCGLGDVQGICGANCRHSYGPGDGEHNPFEDFDSEENRQAYDLSQKQRAMERRIRKAKRELMGLKSGIDNAELPQVKEKLQELYDRKAIALKRGNEQYRDFCEGNGLKTREQRINVAQFDREQAKAARAAAKRAETAPTDASAVLENKSMHSGTNKPSGAAEQANYRYINPENRYPNAEPNSQAVKRLDSYTDKDGNTYTISPNNRNVQNEPEPNEIRVANLLNQKIGGEVCHVPKVNIPQGVKTPDFFFNGNYYDLKTLTENATENTVFNRIQKAMGQADRLIVDVTKSNLSKAIIEAQIKKLFWSRNTASLQEVMFIRGDEIVHIVLREQKE